MRHTRLPIAALCACLAASVLLGGAVPAAATPVRTDFTVTGAEGLRLFVREVRDPAGSGGRGPLLLVHGGRSGVLASWDVDAPGSSAAAEFAAAGHTVYLMDVRGFGRSPFPPEMAGGRWDAPVAVRSHEAMRDIAAVVAEIRRRHPGEPRLAAMGWATGSQWLGHYAALHPEAISHLVYYNAAYGGPAGGWTLQGEFGDPERPAELNYARHGAYRLASAQDLAGRWRAEGLDAGFLDRYVALSMEGDDEAARRTPASFRFPSGPIADTLKMVNGRQIFDASSIRAHVLVLRASGDFWSRPVDGQTLLAHLTNAASVRFVELAQASHYVHLQPTPDRQRFLDAVLAFTSAQTAPASR